MVLKKDRIFYLDELRAFAIIAVILCHVGMAYAVQINYLESATVLSYISPGRIGISIFFMISGALLINKEYELSSFFKKRFSRVLIPAFFWKAVFLIIGLATIGMVDYYTYITSNLAFGWFVYGIIGVYLVIPIFNSFIKEYGLRGAEYFLLVWFIYIIIISLGYDEEGFIKYIFNSIGTYIGFAVLGYYLANKNFKIYSNAMMIFSLIVYIACILINLHIINTYKFSFTALSPLCVIECASLFLFFRYANKYAHLHPKRLFSKFHYLIENSFIGKIIYLLSVCSYTIYLINSPIIVYVANSMAIQQFYLIPAVLVISTILLLIIAVILALIPGLNRVIGVKIR